MQSYQAEMYEKEIELYLLQVKESKERSSSYGELCLFED